MGMFRRTRRKLTRKSKKATTGRLKRAWRFMRDNPMDAKPAKVNGFYRPKSTMNKAPDPSWHNDAQHGRVYGPLLVPDKGYGYYDEKGDLKVVHKFPRNSTVGSRRMGTTTVARMSREPEKRSRKRTESASGGKQVCGHRTKDRKSCRFPSKDNCPHHGKKLL